MAVTKTRHDEPEENLGIDIGKLSTILILG
jgi:hypothetical protein